jgi:sugar lactone lactonase YvrE
MMSGSFARRLFGCFSILLAAGSSAPAFAASGYVFSVMAGGQSGNADGVGSAIQFNHPTGLAVDSQGTVYVADTGNDALRIISPSGVSSTETNAPIPSHGAVLYGALTGLAEDPNGDLLIVTPGVIFRRSATSINHGVVYTGNATAVAVDASEAVYIADPSAGGIQRIDPSTQALTTVAGSGSIPGQITGLAVDRSGNIFAYVVGSGSSAAQTGVYKISGGTATEIMPGGGLQTFSTFNGLALDAAGDLFVTNGPYNQPLGDLDSASYSEVRTAAAGSIQSFALPKQFYQDTADLVGSGLPNLEPITGIATDPNGNFYFLVDDLLIKASPVSTGAIPVPPQKVEVAANASTILTVPAEVPHLITDLSGGSQLQWLKNGTAIPGATASTYAITSAQPTDGGIYTLAVQDNTGGTNYSIAVGVNSSPGQTYLAIWSAASSLPTGKLFTSVAFDGSRFMAAAIDGSLLISSDGVSWTAAGAAPAQVNSLISAGSSGGFLGVGNNGSIFQAFAPSYAPAIQPSGTGNVLTGITLGSGLAVVVGFGGATLSAPNATSTWTASTSGTTNNLNAVAYGNSRFVAVGLQSTVISSSDGRTWTPGDLGASADLASVAYGPAGFVAIGRNAAGSSLAFTSADGIAWTPQAPLPVPSTANLVRIVSANSALVAVGAGVVVSSTDGGFSWTSDSAGTTLTLEGVAYGLGRFLAVGDQGSVSQTVVAQAHLVNLSSSALVGPGINDLVAGFTIGGSAAKQLLLRAVGPGLAQFGVTNLLALPQLTLFSGNGVPVASNLGWNGSPALAAIFTQVGAFALPLNSADAALVQTVAVGGGTAQVNGTNGSTGVALAEIYDADSGTPRSHLINLSSRAEIGTSGVPLVAGFVISGTTADTVLIRGIGPGLNQFGLTGTLSAPVLTLYDRSGTIIATNTAWGGSTALSTTFNQVGAFGLTANSNDTALLETLPPGNYTAQVTGASGSTGLGLVEIYEIPQNP